MQVPDEKPAEPAKPEKDPGWWKPSAGECRSCKGTIWSRFPTRAWKKGDPRFDYFNVCPACDLIVFEDKDART